MCRFRCKNCKEQYVGCHATCEKYKEDCKRNDLEKLKMLEYKQSRRYDPITALQLTELKRKVKEE